MKFYFNDPLTLREILVFDTVVGKQLTLGERTCIHQWMARGVRLSSFLMMRIEHLYVEMQDTNWEVPDLRYSVDRELEISNFNTGNWKPSTINN